MQQCAEKVKKMQETVAEQTVEALKKAAKITSLAGQDLDVAVGQTPHEIVYRKHRVKLLRYLPTGKTVAQTPILICFALVNRPYVMDLIPGKSIIEILVKSGFEVYLIDWGYPTDADKDDGLDVHVNLYIDRMVDKVCELSRQKQVTLLGYCMGGAMSMMYTALHQEKIKNLVTLATPFDFGASENILSKWGRDLPVEDIVNTFGNCPGWFLNMGFDAMKPFDKIDKMINITDGILDDDFRTLFTAMEKWVSDAVSVPGKAYEEFLRGGFRENRLMKNEFCVGEQVVDLKKITCSYLNLVAEKDTLVPPVSSLKIGDYLGSEDKKLMTCPTGHIGLAVSGKTLKTLWPEAAAWMKERSGGNRKVAKRLVEPVS